MIVKLKQFFKEYFDKRFEEFSRVLEEEGEKEAFLKAFIEGYEFSPNIILDLNDNILEITNLHRALPERVKEFIREWKEL